jgi:hypothetical protein
MPRLQNGRRLDDALSASRGSPTIPGNEFLFSAILTERIVRNGNGRLHLQRPSAGILGEMAWEASMSTSGSFGRV